MANRFDCLVVGDVLFDIFLEHSVGLHTFRKGGTSYLDFAKIDFGGAGNVAEGLSLLGAKTCFIGKAGKDYWGELYESDLTAKGVSCKIYTEKSASTGFAIVAQEQEGERSFLVFRGANDKLSTQEINKSIDLIRDSNHLYLSGYSLANNPQRNAILHAVALARKNNLRIIFDPGAHNLIKSNFQLFNNVFDKCDVFCPNVEEAKAITKTSRLETAIKRLQRNDKLITLKCGEDGCILIKGNMVFRSEGFKLSRLDTTGAGDAFAAALIYGLVNSLLPEAIAKLANWFAAQMIKSVGARAFPSKKEINQFLIGSRKHQPGTDCQLDFRVWHTRL